MKKRNTIAWCDPGEKASHQIISKKNVSNGLRCAQPNLLCKCFTANDDYKKKEDQLQSLEMNNYLRSHLLTRDKLLCDKKQMHSPSATIWRKYKSTSLKR